MTAPDCENCPLRDQHSQVYSTVPTRAKFAIVGEAPGPQEERQGRPFVGESGDLLDRVLYRFGINRGEAIVTNALLCRPWRPLSDAEWSQALTACGKRLQSELPVRHVLVVGARALQSLDPKRRGGILAWSGGYIEHDRRVLVPTMHPAYVMRSPAYTPIFWMYVRNFALALRGDTPKPIRAILRPGRAALVALRSFRTAARTSWDIENLGDDPYANKIMSIAVTTEDLAVSLPFDAYDTRKYGTVRGLLEYPDGPALLALLRELWQNSTPKTFQNGQHDIAGLSPEHRLGPCGNFADDTFIADLALVPGVKHDLGALYAREVLDRRYKQEFGAGAGDSKGAAKFAHRPQRTLRTYNAHDGIAAAIIQRRQARNLDETPGARTAYELYMNLTREAAIPMRERGLEIDLDARAELRTEVTARIEEARKDVLAVTANCDLPEFNPRSFPQCAELFYKRLGLTPTHFSEDTGEPSTDEDALTEILRGTHEIARAVAQALLKFRKYDKLLSTYIDGLPIEGHPARVRSTWLVGGARTARWASQNPNCQNIPKGMRRMFRARPGMWFVEADFSQLELRILAQLCNAKKLIEAYREKRDVHQMNADFLYDWAHPGQPANDKERDFAKRFVYGLGYGGDDQTLWEALVVDSPGVTIELIAKLRAAYFGLHTEILPWQDRLFADAKANGYVEMPLSGRRIKNWGRPERTEIVNYPVQGTAADLINGPTLKIVRQIDWKNTALVLQVHDALYLESNDPEKAADLLRSNLTQHIVLNGVEMTYPVDVKIGRNWGPYHATKNPEGMKKHD